MLIVSILIIIGVILLMVLSYIYELESGPTPHQENYATADATCVQYDESKCENKEVVVRGENFFCTYGLKSNAAKDPRCYARQS